MGELHEDLERCLVDARCTAADASRAACCCEEGRTREAKRLLIRQRRHLLDEVHDMQRGIDAIDHMLYRMSEKGDGMRGAGTGECGDAATAYGSRAPKRGGCDV